MNSPTTSHSSHLGVAPELACDTIWEVANQHLDLLKKFGGRRLITSRGLLSGLLLPILQECGNSVTKCLDLPPNRLFSRRRLRMTTDELENESGDRVFLVRGILELGEGSGCSLIQRHAKSDAEYSIIRTEFSLCDTRLVEDPWAVKAAGGQKSYYIRSVVQFLHDGSVPLLPVLDACVALAVG